ncbi:MAG: 50S ribosomal protein L24 [Kiritimatiellia bacterium]
MSVARIKKDDLVIVITGIFAGQTAKVLRVVPGKGKAFVEGINVVKKSVRRSQATPQSKDGFIKREAPIDLSNLMPYDPDKKKGTRITRERQGDQLVRRSKRSGKLLQ